MNEEQLCLALIKSDTEQEVLSILQENNLWGAYTFHGGGGL